MVLMNAIYFKGSWKNAFDTNQTAYFPFYNGGIESVQVKTMARRSTIMYCALPELKSQAVQLPYSGDRYSMVIVLPNDRTGLPQLIEALSVRTLLTLQKELSPDEVKLRLPKFELRTSYKLVDPLKKLGLISIFSDEADLSGISSDKELIVSEVVHKAMVDVSEEGTVAAAATGVKLSYEERTAERGASGGQPARKVEERAVRGWGRAGTIEPFWLVWPMVVSGSIPPAKFGSGLAEAASPGHTGLGYDDPGVAPQRDPGCDSPEQLAYAALAYGKDDPQIVAVLTLAPESGIQGRRTALDFAQLPVVVQPGHGEGNFGACGVETRALHAVPCKCGLESHEREVACLKDQLFGAASRVKWFPQRERERERE
ncbi:hypothetical protein HPB47_014603 [Ixodes persulcatus]|uniref:Uncharacterized protein n=1 Tax=Ixodes persulcatus TaxID=34615 RepID=A0AC60QWZ4_IXOPE|nr:hypothetical protein HPB47_014603 [Ixodes persulcatus]